MSNEAKVKCPQCGADIDVNSLLSGQLEAEFKKKYNALWQKSQQEVTAEKTKLALKEAELEKLKAQQELLMEEKVSERLKTEEKRIAESLKAKLEADKKDEMDLIQKELQEKSLQVKELNQAKIEIEKIKREKEELKSLMEMEAQKTINEQLSLEREKIQKLEQERSQLQIKELQKQLDDQKKLTEEMKRKQEQGSMQLQGEVQELAIEDWLRQQFPFDNIDEVKKGARGADCIQLVNTRLSQNCGSIYYESKRTKEFQLSWIEKFKADMRAANATFGVLVTEAMPKDMDRFGQKEGIWVCTFEEFKALCFVIRESVILLHNAKESQDNKGDKAIMLYEFLTGNEFRMQVEAIVEGFSQMQDDLNAERRAMERLWKTREKQINKVVENTIHMYGSIRGIAGKAIQPIKMLELGMGEGDED